MSGGEAAQSPTGGPPGGDAKPSAIAVLVLVVVLALLGCGLVAYAVHHQLGSDARGPGLSAHPTGTVLMSMRELARLETNELHFEKVVDLTDRQSRFFGLVTASDAILLVAAGDVTLGVDLTKLRDDDVTVDRATGEARLTLPVPEVLSARLDEAHTYVYRRSTSALAQRNEQLESSARKEALRAITEAAKDGAVIDKARAQAEKQLQFLLQRFGIGKVTVGWRPS